MIILLKKYFIFYSSEFGGGSVTCSFSVKWKKFREWARIMDLSNGERSNNFIICNFEGT